MQSVEIFGVSYKRVIIFLNLQLVLFATTLYFLFKFIASCFYLATKVTKIEKKSSLADVKKKENGNIVFEQFQEKERMQRCSRFPLRLYEPTPATFVMGFDVGLRFVVNWVVAYNFDFSRVLPRYKNCYNLKQLFCNCSL